jgi:hypothetical protein
VFLLPAITILFAEYARDIRPGLAILATALVLTFVTQRPFMAMDTTEYFRNWFPAYIFRTDAATPIFWTTWWVRLALTCGGAIALAVLQWRVIKTPGALRPEAPTR